MAKDQWKTCLLFHRTLDHPRPRQENKGYKVFIFSNCKSERCLTWDIFIQINSAFTETRNTTVMLTYRGSKPKGFVKSQIFFLVFGFVTLGDLNVYEQNKRVKAQRHSFSLSGLEVICDLTPTVDYTFFRGMYHLQSCIQWWTNEFCSD